MLKIKILFISCCVVIICFSCSSIRQIRPLEKGESALSASVGGPITKVGSIYIPLPLLNIGYNYGLIDRKLDLEAGFDVTSSIYSLMHLDIGTNYRPWLSKKWRPGFIVTPKFFFVTDFEAFKFYPDLGLTLFWQLRDYWHIYSGLDNFFELSRIRHDGNKQEHHWLIAPFLGIDMGNRHWGFQIETRAYIPNLLNGQRSIKNIGFGDYGIIGLFLGVHYTFERKQK
jgi:hypothetical protein